jgi:hypothetical protein
MTEQRLAVHPFGPGVRARGGVGVAQTDGPIMKESLSNPTEAGVNKRTRRYSGSNSGTSSSVSAITSSNSGSPTRTKSLKR